MQAHVAKARHRIGAQGAIFAHARTLQCSWVLDGTWAPHQRLELETDLIAAHLLATDRVPSGQFLGARSIETVL